MPFPTRNPWHENRRYLLELAEFLIDRCDLATPDAVLDFFRRPQKWTPEWERYVAANADSNRYDELAELEPAGR